MERAGLRKPGSLIPWPGNLAQTALPEQEGEFGVAAAAAQKVPCGSLIVGEQAVPQRAIGGDTEPVAGTAEWFRNAGDQADLTDPVG